MLLSILIPTYNRSSFLIKNLESLVKIIKKNELSNKVEIIVSNNYSTDDTHERVTELLEKNNLKFIKYYLREHNTGLESNALFVLSKSQARYVMFLGDDDYIHEQYLIRILKKIGANDQIWAVVPSYTAIDIKGKLLNNGRDLNKRSKIFSKGFLNCLTNSWRGHQLSGLTFKNEGLLGAYTKNNVNNIYPFIYFLSYCCLRGNTWHFTDFPVRVTALCQTGKDWGYGEDGLVSDIFDNYVKLEGLSFFEKNILELKLLWVQNWRIFRSLDKGFVEFASTLKLILFSKNSLILTKILIPILVAILLCLKLIKKTLKLFYNLIMKLKASINKVFSRFRFFLYNYLIRGDNFYCLFCGANFKTTLPTGLDNPIAKTLVGGGRRKVLCPRCKSNDRERLIYYYLKTETNFLKSNKQYNVLHIAPENNLRKIFSQKQNFNYYPGDLHPKNRDFKLDITNLSQFKNNYFDLIICSHVLEHVPNDKQAMKELYRVLKPNGVAILQVPISRILKKTYEDFSIVTPKERLKAFGQRDHVRIYGQDYVQRLKVAGFDVEEYKIFKTLSQELIKKYCLNSEEVLFVGRKND